ncbi:MAG: T9SS type A sorting domain-containing protein [Saprospiraceae bacterium]|nr:T9SS type A sorting domain-containing protein [Saprospiraceae bacterium]
MKRNQFLKTLGATGLASLLPTSGAKSTTVTPTVEPPLMCTLIPSETEGPFPLDLTTNNYYLRKDIREAQTGVRLNVKMKIVGLANCLPMQNVRVNIWHCSKEGVYSGYNNNMNPGDANAKHLRGYQLTDANGIVEFVTIFPGWYNGRITHLHFKVSVSSTYAAVSQFSFDVAAKNAVYRANPSFYPRGDDPMTFAQDNVFSDGSSTQIATLTANATTGGYDSYFEVAVQGTGTTGIGHIEKENAKQFILGQNFPNPYVDQTHIPLTLYYPSDVMIDLYDLQGRKVATIAHGNYTNGEHNIPINLKNLGLSLGNYVYQLEVKNSNGIYRDIKMITAMK